MPSTLVPLSLTPIFDNDGVVASGATLYFYKTGTLDPITVYTDHNLGSPYAQPIVLSGSGRVPPIYVGDGYDYRIRILDKYGNLLEDIPFLPKAADTEGSAPPAPDTAFDVGDVVWRYATGGTRAGWVRCNGGSIGSALSPATEYANAEAHDLFVWLWGQDAGINLLTVTTGKGASAEADWLSNKAIDLPDMRGRVLAGVSGMGRTPAVDRLSGATFEAGNTTQVGARGGSATVTLTAAMIPAHTHSVTDPGHTHGASQAAHSHTITIFDPGHAHSYNDPGHTHAVSDPTHAHGHAPNVSILTGDYGLVTNAQVSGAVGYANRVVGVASPFIEGSDLTAFNGTGISIIPVVTGLTINWVATGITAGSDSLSPAVTVNSATTGLTVNANTGGDGAHNNVQPFMLGTWYMRL